MDILENKNYEFTFNLLKQIGNYKHWKENFVFSPLSIFIELAVLMEGADFYTKTQFADIIGQHFTNYYQRSYFIDKKTMKQFCSIFHSIPLQSDYLRFIKQKYGTFNNETNFKNKNHSLIKINNWISDVTNDSVSWSLDLNKLNSTSKFIICGTALLSSSFLNHFRRTNMEFFLKYNKSIQVKAVTNTSLINFNIFTVRNISVCEIPFNDDRFSAMIIMPQMQDELYKIVQNLNVIIYLIYNCFRIVYILIGNKTWFCNV